jgi:DNA-binding MurR/RpiR family transcriptional regulator
MADRSDDLDNRRLSSPSDRYDARMARRSSTMLQKRVIERERELLSAAWDDVLADASIAEAAARIVGARRRLVIGSGRSHAYASLLAFDLGVGLSQVTLVDGTVVRAVDLLADVRADDVMIAFSLRRYRRYTVDIASAFAAAGGQLVAITDSVDAPLAKIANQTILVGTESASYLDSPTVVAAVVEVLATLTIASAKGARRRLGERERLTTALDLYFND